MRMTKYLVEFIGAFFNNPLRGFFYSPTPLRTCVLSQWRTPGRAAPMGSKSRSHGGFVE